MGYTIITGPSQRNFPPSIQHCNQSHPEKPRWCLRKMSGHTTIYVPIFGSHTVYPIRFPSKGNSLRVQDQQKLELIKLDCKHTPCKIYSILKERKH